MFHGKSRTGKEDTAAEREFSGLLPFFIGHPSRARASGVVHELSTITWFHGVSVSSAIVKLNSAIASTVLSYLAPPTATLNFHK